MHCSDKAETVGSNPTICTMICILCKEKEVPEEYQEVELCSECVQTILSEILSS